MLTIFALLRSVFLYVLLVFVPQCLWLYSNGFGEATRPGSQLCEDCSLMPPGYFSTQPTTKEGALQEKSGKDFITFNKTFMYEQLCGGMCGLLSNDGEDNHNLYWMEDLDSLKTDGGWYEVYCLLHENIFYVLHVQLYLYM